MVVGACFLSLTALTPFLTGCSTANHKLAGDPLFGEFGPKGTGPGNAPVASPTKSKAEVSTTPTSSLAPSLANLAALSGSRPPLAIGQPVNTPDSNDHPIALASTPKTGATLSPPQPIVQPVPRDQVDPVLPASSWGQGPGAAVAGTPSPQKPGAGLNANPPQLTPTDDPLLAKLRSRGITWQKAQNVAGGVKFSCIVPNLHNPEISRMYEAIGPDYSAAVRAVLWKIDRDRQ